MATRSPKPAFDAELLDRLLAGRDPKTALESDGLIGELKKALAERMLNAELDSHLDSEPEQAAGNHRNGSSPKTVLTEDGSLTLSIPRDRHGRFEPALIAKYRRRFPGFDDKIIALYARGMSTRDIQAHVGELYGVTISPDLVSAVTDAVIDEVTAWQSRPLEPTYAIVFFDALRVKIRDEGVVDLIMVDAFVNRTVGALRLADVAIDTLVGDQQRHGSIEVTSWRASRAAR